MNIGFEISRMIDRIKGRYIVLAIFILTIVHAGVYKYLSEKSPENGLLLPEKNKTKKVSFGDALYFSIVTEATLGYGDIQPIGYSRGIACIQVICGLIFAGIGVAKITSVRGSVLKRAAYQSSGYWIESFTKKGGATYFSFCRFFMNGDDLCYTGENYDYNGNSEGSFKGCATKVDANVISFEYYNIVKKHLFDDGVCQVTFSSGPDSRKWARHTATCHDHGKTERTEYIGYRASKEEKTIMLGENAQKKVELIQKFINDYNAKYPNLNK